MEIEKEANELKIPPIIKFLSENEISFNDINKELVIHLYLFAIVF